MPPSTACRASAVAEVTYVSMDTTLGSPMARVVAGGVSSTRRIAFRVGSTFPALSWLYHSMKCTPSLASVKVCGTTYATHAPPSRRYIVLWIPIPLGSVTAKERGVADVMYVPDAV